MTEAMCLCPFATAYLVEVAQNKDEHSSGLWESISNQKCHTKSVSSQPHSEKMEQFSCCQSEHSGQLAGAETDLHVKEREKKKKTHYGEYAMSQLRDF